MIQGYGTFSKSLSECRVGSLSQDDVRLEEAGTQNPPLKLSGINMANLLEIILLLAGCEAFLLHGQLWIPRSGICKNIITKKKRKRLDIEVEMSYTDMQTCHLLRKFHT